MFELSSKTTSIGIMFHIRSFEVIPGTSMFGCLQRCGVGVVLPKHLQLVVIITYSPN